MRRDIRFGWCELTQSLTYKRESGSRWYGGMNQSVRKLSVVFEVQSLHNPQLLASHEDAARISTYQKDSIAKS